jgi:hypothetical protein
MAIELLDCDGDNRTMYVIHSYNGIYYDMYSYDTYQECLEKGRDIIDYICYNYGEVATDEELEDDPPRQELFETNKVKELERFHPDRKFNVTKIDFYMGTILNITTIE